MSLFAGRFRCELESPIGDHPADHLLTDKRQQLFRQVLARRTTRLAVVIEDCYDPHNATAVMRTCDCLGIHRVHVTTERSAFKINRRVSQGVHRYIDLRIHHDIGQAYAELRADGYKIMVSDLKEDALCGPRQLQAALAEQPLALVFGSEGYGVSEAAANGADGFFLVPMAGFSQSLNLSATAAMTLFSLRGELLAADVAGDMPAEEQRFWYDQWLQNQRGEAAAQAIAAADTYELPLDPRARIDHDRKGNELESYGQVRNPRTGKKPRQ